MMQYCDDREWYFCKARKMTNNEDARALFSVLFYLAVALEDDIEVAGRRAAAAAWFVNPEWASSHE